MCVQLRVFGKIDKSHSSGANFLNKLVLASYDWQSLTNFEGLAVCWAVIQIGIWRKEPLAFQTLFGLACWVSQLGSESPFPNYVPRDCTCLFFE